MCRASLTVPFVALFLLSAAPAHGLCRDDALALIQSTAVSSANRLSFDEGKLAFEPGQEVEVNVFGAKWVNCTIVGPGAKQDTYKIHVPSFPSGHQDLPDVKVATLRDPRAEEKRLAQKAAEAAKVKADADARQRAEAAEKKAAEAEERRLAELMAHTFESGELVEVKRVEKDGNVTWIKAKIEGKGSQANKYNISVGGTKIANIHYLALRKDAAFHFEVGEHVEVKAKGGNLTWVKCIITSRGDQTNTYHIHIPAAPKNKRDVMNVPATSLRKEPLPVWSPRFEVGEFMEVKVTDEKNLSSWVRCNVTGKAVQVETYHLHVMNNATGYRWENVSALLLRETGEGLRLLEKKHAEQKAAEEARRKAEEERKRKEEEAAMRQAYQMRKIQEVEDEKKRVEDQLKFEEEKAKTDPLMYIKVQARKKMQELSQNNKEKRKKAERDMAEQEKQQKQMLQQMEDRRRERLERKLNDEWQAAEGQGEAWIKESSPTQDPWAAYQEYEKSRREQARKKFEELVTKSKKEEEEAEANLQERRAAVIEQRVLAEKERQRKKKEEDMYQRRGVARMALKRGMMLHSDAQIIKALRPAIDDAERTGMEEEAMVEPSRKLVWALWNSTVAKLRRTIGKTGAPELQRALLEGQAVNLEMERLQNFIKAGEAKKSGAEAPDVQGPSAKDVAAAQSAVAQVSSASTRQTLEEALAHNYSAPLLKDVPEFAEVEQAFRHEAGKWAAYYHLKDAERMKDGADLHTALEQAEKANVTKVIVQEGRVISGLLDAVESQDTAALQGAVAAAEKFTEECQQAGVVSNDTAVPLNAARRALSAEMAKEPARLNLRSAVAAGDLKALESAIFRSELARLKESDLAEARSMRQKLIADKRAEKERSAQEAADQRKAARDAKEQARTDAKQRSQEAAKAEQDAVAQRKAKEASERRAKEAEAAAAVQERQKREVADFRARKAREAEEFRMKEQHAAQDKIARKEAKLKAKVDAKEARAKEKAARAQQQQEARAAAAKAKEEAREAAQKAREERERKEREAYELEKKAREERERQQREAREEAEKRAREETERKEREEAERKAKEEAEHRRAQEEETRKAREEAERKAEEERKAKEEIDRKKREEEEIANKAKAEQLEKERKARAAEEARIRSEQEWKAKEAALEKGKREAAAQERIAARKAAQDEEDRKARELQEQKAKAERERAAKAEEDRKLKEKRQYAEAARARKAAAAAAAAAKPLAAPTTAAPAAPAATAAKADAQAPAPEADEEVS